MPPLTASVRAAVVASALLLVSLTAGPVAADSPPSTPLANTAAPAAGGTLDVIGVVATYADTGAAWRGHRTAISGGFGQVATAATRGGDGKRLRIPVESPAQYAAVARALVSTGGVSVRVEPDVRVHPVGAPSNDTYVSDQWGLWPAAGNPASANAADAWGTTTGAGVRVAIADTGWVDHPDLPTPDPGYDFVTSTTTGADGDGRDPDPADPGNACGTNSSVWHGQHIAGIIAALTDNDKGVAGVAPDASLLPVRVMGPCGGSLVDVADAIEWAAGGTIAGVPTLAPDQKADVINLSLGAASECFYYLQEAVDFANAQGTVVVAAAGNENSDTAGSTPANCAQVLTVAAHNEYGSKASFSNYGDAVDVSAPGVQILSTYNTGTTTPGKPAYAWSSGTSMAAPFAAAAAALVLQAYPDLTPAQVMDRLVRNATPFPSGAGCDGCGAGFLNAAAAVLDADGGGPDPGPGPAPSPGIPTVTAVEVNPDRTVSVTWDSPRAGQVSFDVQARNGRDTISASTLGTAVTLSGLTPGADYVVAVRETVGGASGEWATWPDTIAIPSSLTAPRKVRAKGRSRALTVTIVPAAPLADGQAFRVVVRGRKGPVATVTTTATKLTVRPLTPGKYTAYAAVTHGDDASADRRSRSARVTR